MLDHGRSPRPAGHPRTAPRGRRGAVRRARLRAHHNPQHRASRGLLERMLAGRIETLLEFLLGPPPSPHGAILQREMCDPTGALPVIVRDFVLPQKEATARVVARLPPPPPPP